VLEVEPQAIGRDERSRLLDVRAEHLPQRRVQKMRRRVVASRRVANVGVDFGSDAVPYPQLPRGDVDAVRPRQAGPDARQPFDRGRRVRGLVDDPARIRHLAARLEVKRRPGERRIPVLIGGQRIDRLPLLVEERDDRHVATRVGEQEIALEPVRRRSELAVGIARPSVKSSVFLPPPNALPARAFTRCASMAASKAARSTVTPCVAAVSSTKSYGTPNVS